MSTRRYKFNITDITALATAYPKAVSETHIPARTELKPNYSVIAKLLDCDIAVPGIELFQDGATADESTPEFVVEHAKRPHVTKKNDGAV